MSGDSSNQPSQAVQDPQQQPASEEPASPRTRDTKKKKEKKDRACPRKNNRRRRKAAGAQGAPGASPASPRTSLSSDAGHTTGSHRRCSVLLSRMDSPTSVASSSTSSYSGWVEHLLPQGLLSPYFGSSLNGGAHPNNTGAAAVAAAAAAAAAITSPVCNGTGGVIMLAHGSSHSGGVDPAAGSLLHLAVPAQPPMANGIAASVNGHQRVGAIALWDHDWEGEAEPQVAASTKSDDESAEEALERQRWREWAIAAAEAERTRRVREREEEERGERRARQAWALHAVEEERRRRTSQYFLDAMATTAWFTDTISSFCAEYEIVCPYSHLGCRHICLRNELEAHLLRGCAFNREPPREAYTQVDTTEYEVMCPNAVLGCTHSCPRQALPAHLEAECCYGAEGPREALEERERSLQMVMRQAEEERARRVDMEQRGEWQRDAQALRARKFLHTLLSSQVRRAVALLHAEVLEYAEASAAAEDARAAALDELVAAIRGAVAALWPAAHVRLFGSAASGLLARGSDIDLVVCLEVPRPPPLPQSTPHRALSGGVGGGGAAGSPLLRSARHRRAPSAEAPPRPYHARAGAGGSGGSGSGWGSVAAAALSTGARIQVLAEHLRAALPKLDVLAVVDHGRVPIIRAEARHRGSSGARFSVDISVDGPAHTGVATTALAAALVAALPPLAPLVRVLKHLLRARGLNCPYTGGLSSYALTLMATFVVLQERRAAGGGGGGSGAAAAHAHTNGVAAAAAAAAPAGSVAAAANAAVAGDAQSHRGDVRVRRGSASTLPLLHAAAAPAPPSPSAALPPVTPCSSPLLQSKAAPPPPAALLQGAQLPTQQRQQQAPAPSAQRDAPQPAAAASLVPQPRLASPAHANASPLLAVPSPSPPAPSAGDDAEVARRPSRSPKQHPAAQCSMKADPPKACVAATQHQLLPAPSPKPLPLSHQHKAAQQCDQQDSAPPQRSLRQHGKHAVEHRLAQPVPPPPPLPPSPQQRAQWHREATAAHERRQPLPPPPPPLPAAALQRGLPHTQQWDRATRQAWVGWHVARAIVACESSTGAALAAAAAAAAEHCAQRPGTAPPCRVAPPLRSPDARAPAAAAAAAPLHAADACAEALRGASTDGSSRAGGGSGAGRAAHRTAAASVVPCAADAAPWAACASTCDGGDLKPTAASAAAAAAPSAAPPPPPPPPPPLQPPAHAEMPLDKEGEPVLGKLLLDFLQLFGQDFELGREGLSVRSGGFRFKLQGTPTHPQASDPVVIEDPLDVMNNVGRSSYAVQSVQRCFSDALTTLKSAMARIDDGGSPAGSASDGGFPAKGGGGAGGGGGAASRAVLSTGLLAHICEHPGGEAWGASG